MLTWIIPSGKYVKETKLVNGTEKQTVTYYLEKDIPATYELKVKSQPQTWQIFSALFKGFVKQSNIIAFILIIGGAFWIMNQSKAIDVAIFTFLRFVRKLEHNAFMRTIGVDNMVIVLVMIMFSLFGAIFGMSEENHSIYNHFNSTCHFDGL
jgi:uncharacterized ion transporter superfamily protein YfcC